MKRQPFLTGRDLSLLFITFFLISIESIGQLPNNIPAADKLFGLSKFWQEVNYNFVYLDRINRYKWDSTYKQLMLKVQNTQSDYEYYRLLQRFCATLRDGHTNIYMPPLMALAVNSTQFGDYLLFVENIDDRAIIVRTNFSRKDEIPAGSEIVEVNGKQTADYIREEVAPYISSSTDYVLKDMSIKNLLQGIQGDQYLVKIRKPGGEMISLKLTHAPVMETTVYPPVPKARELLEFKWIDKKIAYLSLNSFENPMIDTLFLRLLPELYKARGLVIDLRNNGGGSTGIGTAILQYLTPDTVLFGAKSSCRLHMPAFKAWGRMVNPKDTSGNEWASKALLSFKDIYYYTLSYSSQRVQIRERRIVVPTVILTGHKTASAAEDFLIYADNQKHMTRIGENTFGSTGQPFSFDLPGGGSARVCTKKDTYPDGREFVGFGIKPHIEVKRTLNDYLQQKDPVLDKATEYLNKMLK